MPVQKFRSIEEMGEPPLRRPGDPELYRAITRVWELGRRTNPRRFAHGVFKFRSIEEMNVAQDRALADHIAELIRQREGR